MNYKKMRVDSLNSAKALGYSVNPSLPLLDGLKKIRPLELTLSRLLTLSAVTAVSYGYTREDCFYWLQQEDLICSLSQIEKTYLDSKPFLIEDYSFRWGVEALWTLTWCCGYHNSLDFSKVCGDILIDLLPDLNKLESSIKFRRNARMKSVSEIAKALDLAYCLHWSIRDAEIHGREIPRVLSPNVIIQRRKALEWMFSEENWDEVTLDT